MEQNVEIKKPDPNPRDMAAGEIVVNVQKTDENGVTISLNLAKRSSRLKIWSIR